MLSKAEVCLFLQYCMISRKGMPPESDGFRLRWFETIRCGWKGIEGYLGVFLNFFGRKVGVQ